MKIEKVGFPKNSILSKDINSYDYIDSFAGTIINKKRNISITEIGEAFFTSSPKWSKKLFSLRNKIVQLFGLKTGRQDKPKKFTCEPGEQVGIFTVFDKTEDEIILGENDKHLDFRVSLLYSKEQNTALGNSLTISTTVTYHNRLGIFYFLPVRPFHQLIVPVMLKKIIRKLEGEK